jgi:hypothetical protein
MKATNTLELPVAACKEVALKIISGLPPAEFCEVAEEMQRLARRKSFEALDRMRLTARRSGLRRRDFEKALGSVRAAKRQKRDRRS